MHALHVVGAVCVAAAPQQMVQQMVQPCSLARPDANPGECGALEGQQAARAVPANGVGAASQLGATRHIAAVQDSMRPPAPSASKPCLAPPRPHYLEGLHGGPFHSS
ncbi:hypothetical protein ABPG75_012035 [Micractinium tetrahymenae]